ncbi:MAG: Calx-beta domain-containing protein, partial [Luteimonas sp.]
APAEVRIDVLGLYSDELVAMEGSVEAAETELANTIAVATQAHVDSGSRVRLALVATRQVTVPPGIFNDAALYAITDNALEGVDLEALRDAAGADLVMLLRPYTPGDPSCGIAWLAGSGRQRSNVYPESGFSVSNVCGQYVVAHELAHNMGSTHDRVTEARPDGTLGYGAYAYSFGYQQDGPPAFATIMSYFGPQVGYFSNPLNDGCGAPCGVAEIADNVRSLNNMATAIAAFRGPPGSVSIADVDGLEPVDGQERDQRVPVLLSGAAPPGGVTLEIQVLDGTAKAGVDYRLPSDTTLYIPEGEREAPFSLTLIGDDKVEPDETVILKLVGVTGASLHDAEALLTIGNDDPRLVLSGAVRFPAGATPPSVPFPLYSSGGDGGFYSPSLTHWVSPPDFRFEIQAVEDSEIDLFGDAPEPFMAPYTNMGALHADTERDYYLVRGAVLVTSVAVPEGDPMPTGSIPFQLAWSEAPVSYQMNADYSPPDYSYRQVFVPGTVVDLWITPPAPYQRYVERLRMDADVTHVARLSTSNSLAVRSPAWVSEAAGTTVAIVFELASAPATAVTLDYRTRSRSASRAEDYVHASGSLTFAPGETEKQVNLEILDDDRFEPTEYFELLTENLQGATTRNGTQRIDIRDDDATTGGPGPKQPSP